MRLPGMRNRFFSTRLDCRLLLHPCPSPVRHFRRSSTFVQLLDLPTLHVYLLLSSSQTLYRATTSALS